MSDLTTSIRAIESSETLDLRHRILRPNQSLEHCAYPLDDDAETLHLGCFMAGDLVGIASLFHEPQPGQQNPRSWRVRGMAVLVVRAQQFVIEATGVVLRQQIRAAGSWDGQACAPLAGRLVRSGHSRAALVHIRN